MLLCSFETTCYFVPVLKLYNMFQPSFYRKLNIPGIMFFISLGPPLHKYTLLIIPQYTACIGGST